MTRHPKEEDLKKVHIVEATEDEDGMQLYEQFGEATLETSVI